MMSNRGEGEGRVTKMYLTGDNWSYGRHAGNAVRLHQRPVCPGLGAIAAGLRCQHLGGQAQLHQRGAKMGG
eukprot:1115264-Pelagomonas_calceolata.AAC.1